MPFSGCSLSNSFFMVESSSMELPPPIHIPECSISRLENVWRVESQLILRLYIELAVIRSWGREISCTMVAKLHSVRVQEWLYEGR